MSKTVLKVADMKSYFSGIAQKCEIKFLMGNLISLKDKKQRGSRFQNCGGRVIVYCQLHVTLLRLM